ncbi:TadE/TadG family type IV pilus assembly protein [uncultured Tateyamaria sp.]|uniref:TadE/TadG family type IV pilus assembly protein n=1 Tax=uncultured Tateyamaria sp. TaxID=455651 RepID=UPI0026181EBA|nr:TadE/TadG family type IV pilus assembly protein [uncultured Tateyamaria sp.]
MQRIFTYLRSFRDEDRGSIAVETVLILPVLFWGYLSMFAIFDAYRQHSINQKAAYTIGDIISRETNPLDASYMSGTQQMLAYLTANEVSDVAIRITSVTYDEDNDEYIKFWSEKKGWMPALSNEAIQALREDLPIMPDNETVVVVETFVRYDPPFNTGLTNREIHNFVFTRPRYAPQVLFNESTSF